MTETTPGSCAAPAAGAGSRGASLAALDSSCGSGAMGAAYFAAAAAAAPSTS